MDITVVEGPRTTAFTTLARVRLELRLTTTARDEQLTALIEEVSDDIVAYCGQPFRRQTVTERQVGLGRTVQTMWVTPVPKAGVTEVRQLTTTLPTNNPPTVVYDYFVSNPDAGFIFRQERWADTRQYNAWIEIDPAIMPGTPMFEFDYSGGYILPGDDITTSGGQCIANSLDNSFELVGGVTTFPIMVSGETAIVSGYDEDDNNGKFIVVMRTESKLFVNRPLVTESGTNVITVRTRTLPRDLEAACVREVKARYFAQGRDPAIWAESLGDWSVDYGRRGATGEDTAEGLSPLVARSLEKYIRLD